MDSDDQRDVGTRPSDDDEPLTKRTQEEIVNKVLERKREAPYGFFDFAVADLIAYLDIERAGPLLLGTDTKSKSRKAWWEESREHRTPQEAMRVYMPFAWEKANNCRGLSALRTMQHYWAWLWLDGAPDELVNSTLDYEFYGKPTLVAVCNYLDLDPDKWDDGIRVNEEP
jgi:hypothetical protein